MEGSGVLGFFCNGKKRKELWFRALGEVEIYGSLSCSSLPIVWGLDLVWKHTKEKATVADAVQHQRSRNAPTTSFSSALLVFSLLSLICYLYFY